MHFATKLTQVGEGQMNAHELTDPQDRAAAERAEEKACHGIIYYEKLNEAFQFYVRFKGTGQEHMRDLSYLEQETVLTIAAHERDGG